MKGDLVKAKTRIACSSSVRLVTTLKIAHEQIEELAHPMVVQAASKRATEDTLHPIPALR